MVKWFGKGKKEKKIEEEKGEGERKAEERVEEKKAEEKRERGPMLIGYKSDLGKVRPLDEDSVAVLDVSSSYQSDRARKVLAIVADGMGGHNKGEVASRMGAREISNVLLPALLGEITETKEYEKALRKGFNEAHKEVVGYALDNPECMGMGTTASAAIIDGDQLYIGHVGDTRVYVIGDEIMQVTKDHSLVQELVDRGEIKPEEARKHPKKNVITRAIGVKQNWGVDVYSETLGDGSYVLVCCDGLTNELEDEKIRDAVLKAKDPQEACDELVRLANERGGRDNISVVVVGPVKGIPAAQLEAKTVVKKPPKEKE